MIVEDDKSLLGSLTEILRLKGYTVETAQSGQEAIEKSRIRLYDLALIDIVLPDMKGTEVLATLNDSSSRMIKIMLTGHPTVQNASDSLTFGADGYLLKPVCPERLLKTIQEALEGRAQNDERVL